MTRPRCFCGFSASSEVRFNAHLAWADKLPTATARRKHFTLDAPGPANGGQTTLA